MAFPETVRTVPLANVDFPEYKSAYPEGLDLKPGSDLHEKLVSAVMSRTQDSLAEMNMRKATWKQIERQLKVYVPPDVEETALQAKDSRKPISIAIPVLFWNLETLMGVWNAAFIGELPYFTLAGVGPEDQIGAAKLEKHLENQSRLYQHGLALSTAYRDGLVYGMGIVSPEWRRQMGQKTRMRDVMGTDGNGQEFLAGREKYTDYDVVFEGHDLRNIDPWKFLPDPNVSVHRMQDGEFVGYETETNRMVLLERERDMQDTQPFFNVKYLAHTDSDGSPLSDNETSREEKYRSGSTRTATTSKTKVIWMHMRLIPEEWGIGRGTYPEQWVIAVANGKVVIQFGKANLDHGMFPVVVNSPDFDGYSATSLSRMEVGLGLAHWGNFEANSAMAFSRKNLGGSFLIDPSRIEVKNFQDNYGYGALKLFMLTRPAFGSKLGDTVQQLKTSDVTTANMQRLGGIIGMISSSTGAAEVLQGVQRTAPDRLTGDEARATRLNAVNRLRVPLKHTEEMFMFPLTRMMAAQTQQFARMDSFARILGRWEEVLKEESGPEAAGVNISPQDLLINYDIVPNNSSAMNPDYFPMAFKTLEMAVAAMGDPELGKIDRLRLFRHVARIGGFPNFGDFIQKGQPMQVGLQSPEQIEQGVQAGNIIPAEEAFARR